jgi:hypothetical protein
VEALAVRMENPINIVWVRLTITCTPGASLPAGLVLKLPADRVVFASPIPKQVRDHRVRIHAAV